jgi:hypothetical protein
MNAHQQMPALPPKKRPIRCSRNQRVQQAAEAIAAAISADTTVRRDLLRLFVVGRRPSNIRERSDDGQGTAGDATVRKLLDMLRPLLEIVLAHSVENDQVYLAGIRRFFLEPQATYTLYELAALWRVNVRNVRGVFADELAAWREASASACDTFRVSWKDAQRVSITYNFVRPFDVERALGADFERVWTASWRIVPLVIYVPRFMMDVLAFEGVTSSNRTPSARIEQYLFDLFADEHHEKFAVALNERERS